MADWHVHLHRCFQAGDFLSHAAANLRRARQQLDLGDDTPGVLALADVGGQDTFQRLESWAETTRTGWRFDETSEEESRIGFCPRSGDSLILVAGRQVATRRGIEVLALGTRARLPDGKSLAGTADRASGEGALTVVPWGFGKWWLGRRQLVEALLQEADPSSFFLGENGGRPRLAPIPATFRMAGRLGIRVLPGSDPLPFPSHARRAGSFGAVLEGRLDLERPTASLKRLLRENRSQPQVYGEGRRLWSFLQDQIAMQVRKRLRAGST